MDSRDPADSSALRPHPLVLALVAIALALTVFVLEGHVPVRDFESYEPGRYYWGALFFWLLRDHGIVTLRLALASFGAVGIGCALLTLRRVIPEIPLLALAGVIFALWMEPRFRVFEITLSLAAVLVGVRLLEAPTARR